MPAATVAGRGDWLQVKYMASSKQILQNALELRTFLILLDVRTAGWHISRCVFYDVEVAMMQLLGLLVLASLGIGIAALRPRSSKAA